jgi:hypothetical protein
MIGPSTETGTTFFTGAGRNETDSLFYFQDNQLLTYSIPITEGFSLLKFIEPGVQPGYVLLG